MAALDVHIENPAPNKVPPSPWGNVAKASKPQSFSSLMDEEYAREIEKQDKNLEIQIENVETVEDGHCNG